MIRVASLVVPVILAGCGRYGFDPDGRDGGAVLLDSDATLNECTSRTVMPVPTSGLVTGMIVADPLGDVGSCAGEETAEDVYSIDVTVPGSQLLIAGDSAMSSGLPAVYVRSVCDAPESELACDAVDGFGPYPMTTFSVAPGRYFVFVDGQSAADTGAYEVTMQVLLPAGAPCVPTSLRDVCGPELACVQGTCVATACTIDETLTGAGPFTRTLDVASGVDLHAGMCGDAMAAGFRGRERILALDVPAAVSDITVSTDLSGTDFDTVVYVRSGCNTGQLVCDDDSGANHTSIASTGPVPAGLYYIFVDSFLDTSGTADVTITITP